MSNFGGVDPDDCPITGFVAAIAGPFPCTNTRKLFTPRDGVSPVAATSANPSATGRFPPTFVVTAPVAAPEHTSNAPEQSAKLITIDGVPAAPNADGAGNNPSVNCVAASSVPTSDLDTAAYRTLHGPVVMLTTSPKSGVSVPAAPGPPLEKLVKRTDALASGVTDVSPTVGREGTTRVLRSAQCAPGTCGIGAALKIAPPVNWIRSTRWKYRLPSSSTATPARLPTALLNICKTPAGVAAAAPTPSVKANANIRVLIG